MSTNWAPTCRLTRNNCQYQSNIIKTGLPHTLCSKSRSLKKILLSSMFLSMMKSAKVQQRSKICWKRCRNSWLIGRLKRPWLRSRKLGKLVLFSVVLLKGMRRTKCPSLRNHLLLVAKTTVFLGILMKWRPVRLPLETFSLPKIYSRHPNISN